jgi:CO/xanthine dehydrogenase FAD-binding subunit
LQSFATVKEAEAALQTAGTRYLGGGTLVVRAANEGDLSFSTIVRATDPDLSKIEIAFGTARLGASVTMTEVARHPELGAVAKAARAVGGPAIRNMATIGGNLFAPAPYGDFAVALLALDATVQAGGKDVPIGTFLAGREKGAGIVSSVRFNLPADGGFRFIKASRVKPKGISIVSIAALLERDDRDFVTAARIALGCMADRPIRASAAEAALIGKTLTKEGIADAVAAIGKGTRPITDAIASAWYRAEVLPVHFARLLLD